MTTTKTLAAQAEKARESGRRAEADQAELRRMLVALDRQEDGPSRNELARLADGAMSRPMVLNTLQAADMLRDLAGLLPDRTENRPHGFGRPAEDGLDLFRGNWHAQARTSGYVQLSLVPDVWEGDGLDTERERRQTARRVLAALERAGFEVLVRKSAGQDAESALADWGSVYLTRAAGN